MRSKTSRIPFEVYSLQGSGSIILPKYNKTSMEMIQVTRGSVLFAIGCEFVKASECDFVFIPMGTVFSAESPEGNSSIRGVVFDKSIIESNMEMYEAELLSALHILSSSRITLFDTSHPISATLNRCMSDACSEFESKDVCYMLNTKANIYLMMSALLRHFCSSKNDDDRIVYHNVLRLRPAIEYIDENFYDKLYIDELAQIIKVSTDYFTKMFGECIGKTPVEYINNKRINRAMQLLVGTDDSMADIAAKIGFCNANYFHKIFKSYMNKSPLQYRKVYKVK